MFFYIIKRISFLGNISDDFQFYFHSLSGMNIFLVLIACRGNSSDHNVSVDHESWYISFCFFQEPSRFSLEILNDVMEQSVLKGLQEIYCFNGYTDFNWIFSLLSYKVRVTYLSTKNLSNIRTSKSCQKSYDQ